MFSRFASYRSIGSSYRSIGFLLAVASAWAVAGCGAAAVAATASPASPPVIAVGCPEFETHSTVTQDVRATSGQQIVVRLCSNPSTGFSWQAAEVPGALVKLVDQSSEPGATAGGTDQPGLVGAAGIEVLTFEAVAPGAGDVHVLYSQPWAGGTKGSWQLTLHVVVD